MLTSTIDENAGSAVTVSAQAVQLRRQLMAIAFAFARMRPLVAGIRHITANADVTVARIGGLADAFGVVVREFDSVGRSLLGLISEVESELAEMTLAVAGWIKSEYRIRTLGITIETIAGETIAGDDGTLGGPLSISTLSPHALREWEGRRVATFDAIGDEVSGDPAASSTAALLRSSWDAVLGARREILQSLALIEQRCNSLADRLDRVSLVAGRQASFVSVNARIEAGRGSVADLNPIVERISSVAQEVQDVDVEAQERIRDVTGLAQEILAPLRREIVALGLGASEGALEV